MTATFNRLKNYTVDFNNRRVTLCFTTRTHDHFHIECNENGLIEISGEPSLHTLSREEQQTVKEISHLVWRMVYQAKGLSVKEL